MIKIGIKIILTLLAVAGIWLALSCTHAMATLGDDRMKENIVITAHRGGAGYGPENSLSCIRRSLDAGVPSIEIDVQLTKDGHVVVCHDNKVNRTTNGRGKLAEMTLDELRALRLVDADGNALDESLPLLSEVLELIDGRAHLLLEIKRYRDTADKLQQAVADELRRHNALEWTTVQSFSDLTLSQMHALVPELRLEKLAFCKILGLPLLFDGGLRHFSLERYAHVESINFFYGGISEKFVEELHHAGKRVRIWTVNEPERRPNLSVDGIITDYPDLLMSHLGTDK